MHTSGLGLEEPLLCRFSEVQSRRQVRKYIIDMDLFFTVSFQHSSSTNVSESGTSVSERTHLMDLSFAARSHVFRRMCSCYWMEDNGTRIGSHIRGRRCGRDDSIGSDRFSWLTWSRPSGQSSWNVVDGRVAGAGGRRSHFHISRITFWERCSIPGPLYLISCNVINARMYSDKWQK